MVAASTTLCYTGDMKKIIQRIQDIDDQIAEEDKCAREAKERAGRLLTERRKAEAELLDMKIEKKNQLAAEARKKWIEDNPEEFGWFGTLAKIRGNTKSDWFMIHGLISEWWELDDDLNPVTLPKIFTLADFDGIKNPMLAHAMHRAEFFPSVNQARKNGWNIPLTTGEWKVGKYKRKIIIKES